MDVEAISRGILDRFQSDLGWATNGSENARPHDAEAVAIISAAIRTATASVEAERDAARAALKRIAETQPNSYLCTVPGLQAIAAAALAPSGGAATPPARPAEGAA